MGLADRPYQREFPSRRGFLAALPPVVRALVLVNLAVFALDYLVLPLAFGLGHGLPPILSWGAFTIGSAFGEFRIWELLTFQFLHGSVGHLIFNLLGLYFFGPWMERWWGSRKFLVFYLLCGMSGALCYTGLALAGVLPGGTDGALVGASAGIYGIFVGVAVIAPNLRVMLWLPPIELSMRQLAIGVLTISVLLILTKIGGNEGGEAGHLGGALLGFLLVRYPGLLGGMSMGGNIIRLDRRRTEPKLRPRTELSLHDESEVDRILDKISQEGFQSVTSEEREVLRRASEQQRQEPPP
jgi:membrane associated rhomboid family serine protease